MLELRPSCENCNKPLLYNSTEAMICTFECTFCEDCVRDLLKNVCPNCGGGFTARPVRPQKYLEKYPARMDAVYKPVDLGKLAHIFRQLGNIPPEER